MTELLPTLAAYVPPHIARAAWRQTAVSLSDDPQVSRFPAAVLFADVSGFTPLTELLAQKGSEGPEELTRLLNQYFSRMIALIQAEGGEVVKFSGDALTAVFRAGDEPLAHATRRAYQAAAAMQNAMSAFTSLDTSVGPVELGMKIGIGAGDVLEAQIGGARDRWEYVITGDPLRQVAEAEKRAGRGQIVLSPEAEVMMHSGPLPPNPLPQPDWDQVRDGETAAVALRRFVPGNVMAWLEEQLQAWLAVLRPLTVLFVGVEGLVYDQPEAVTRLHDFFRAAQRIIDRYEGTVNKVAVDDKGTILIALFGAPPYAHGDDPERGLRCAMELQEQAHTQGLDLAVGATTGRVFAGPVGSETRREYTVMGDAVNLAARLMGLAGPGQIRCDYETYRWTRNRLAFDVLSPVSVKGKAGLIRVYRPEGEAGAKETAVAPGTPFVGRRAEVARLAAALDEIRSDDALTRCLFIEGEAGIGKSRLVEELVRLMQERGISGLKGMGRAIEQQTPYRAWRDVFASYFGVDEIDDQAERQRRVAERVQDVVPDMVERLPLLNDVLSLGLPENELTNSLDAHLRHESLVSLLLALLYAWTLERPLVLVLEDAHWLDSLSWDLTLQVLRSLSVARVSLFLVVVTRPLKGDGAPPEARTLMEMPLTERMPLDQLSPQETVTLAAIRMGLDADLPEAVADLVRTRAGGNPFFAEELVYALRDGDLIRVEKVDGRRRCVVGGDLAAAARTLPDTVEGIVLSRIDRLPPEEQLTLKVAAVIGRTFAYPALYDTLGEHMEITQRLLTQYLTDLAQLDLTPLEAPEPELTYIFKHIITQEVAYQTLLFSQRRQLHRSVAQWYEGRFGAGQALPATGRLETPLAPYYPLLVYHWHQAGDRDRERRYARLAGQWAAAQYANVEAAGYFTRALELIPADDRPARYEMLLAREAVNDLRGEREAQADDLATLAAIAAELEDDRRGAEVALRQANYAEVTSDYPTALSAADRAVKLAVRAGDASAECDGYITWGKALWRQGDYDAAREPLQRALTLARQAANRRGEAQSLYTLGNVYLFQGEYAAATAHYQQALTLFRAGGHRQGEADSFSNLGVIYYDLSDYPEARDHYEQSLSIYHTIGDRRGETIVLSNLAVIYCDLGDYETAREYHRRALEIRLTIGDRQGEATSLVNLGLVHHNLGENEQARQDCERALAIQRQIGDRRGQAYSQTYLGHALAELGELEAAAQAYKQALALRREFGHHSLAVDDVAGLARVALAQGDEAAARKYAEEIMAWLAEHGVDGIEYPLQVQLSCYRVLRETADGETAVLQQARHLLTQAHDDLLGQAAAINDPELRQMFLENVKAHREIAAIWESRQE